MVHLHHPRREMTDDSYRRSGENFKLLRSRMSEFDKVKRALPPLSDASVSERTLLLMSPNTMPSKALTQALPLLGEYDFIPEDAFIDAASLISFTRERAYTQLLFLNPYGNSHRRKLYLATRDEGLRTIAFDRGALPESWFFDRGGFLASSSSYHRDAWDYELPPGEEQSTKAWIDDFCRNGDTLEENEPREGVEYWRRALAIGNREVVLVVFQRPADTATLYFGGAVGSTDNFTKWVSTLAQHLDQRRFVIVAKKHPLEHEKPDIDGVVYPRDNANINDLIEMSSVVVTINSGVGLISLIHNRPAIACGDAFYQHDGLAYSARSAEQLVRLVHSRLSVSRIAAERFVSFLLNRFYSFGTAQYSTKTEANGAFRKIAYQIDFRRIANLNDKPTILGRPGTRLSDNSYLMQIAGYKAAAPKSIAATSKPTPAPTALPAATVKPATLPTPTATPAPTAKPAALPGPTATRAPSTPNWSPIQRAIFRLCTVALWPALSKDDRNRMAANPLDFFRKAKWGPNRFFGRLLLNKSQRPY
jgi:hypothetical protein